MLEPVLSIVADAAAAGIPAATTAPPDNAGLIQLASTIGAILAALVAGYLGKWKGENAPAHLPPAAPEDTATKLYFDGPLKAIFDHLRTIIGQLSDQGSKLNTLIDELRKVSIRSESLDDVRDLKSDILGVRELIAETSKHTRHDIAAKIQADAAAQVQENARIERRLDGIWDKMNVIEDRMRRGG